MLNYIIQVILFQAAFLAIYDLVLKKETFFQWNRSYLLGASLFSFLIPWFESKNVSNNIPQEYVVMLPEIILSPGSIIENKVNVSGSILSEIHWVFYFGMLIAGILFIYKLIQLYNMISSSKVESFKDHKLVLVPDNNTAFSFFHYIFIGRNIDQKSNVLAHELIHIKQYHSLDLLFFEFQKILFWFNPLSYFFQKRISEIHEFIADSEVALDKDKRTYFQGILNEVFQVEKFAFVCSYYKKSIIKKRIIMLGKNKSKEILKFKYLLIIPILIGMLIYTSCERTEPDLSKNLNVKAVLLEMMQDKIDRGNGSAEQLKFVENFTLPQSVMNPNEENIDTDKIKGLLEIILKIHSGDNNKENKQKDYSNADEVPFQHIDQVPVYPGCEDAENAKECFTEKIQKHIANNFDTSKAKGLGLESGKTRVYVQFQIDKIGNIAEVRSRGAHVDLEEEAEGVISKLPQMKPGIHNGKKVSVKYTLPITLTVD